MAIAFVQVKTGTATSTTPTVTLDNAPIAGNFLVAAIATSGETISLSGWSACTLAVVTGPVGSDYSLRMFYKTSDGSETTVTGASENTVWVMAVTEYSGVATSSQLDTENSVTTSAGTTHTTPTVTPTSDVEQLLTFCSAINNSGTFSNELVNASSTGVTERADPNVSALGFQYSDLIISSTSGSYSASADSSASSVGAAAIAMFKTGTPPPPLMSTHFYLKQGFQ